ncbi:hypothetical protein ACFX2K_034605 [Malus domestica]
MWRQAQQSTCRFIRYFFKSKSISYHHVCNHSGWRTRFDPQILGSTRQALRAALANSPPLNPNLKDQVTHWKKNPSILKIIPLTKLLRCELERLNKATSRHLHLVHACHVFESTFKNQASTALEEASSQIQDQASMALEEITSPIQD